MKIGRLEISPGFLLLAAWLNYMDRQGLFLGGLVSCVLHEFGHLTALYLLEIPVKRIRITVVGAEIQISGSLSYLRELIVALMGPAVNLVIALVLCRVPGGAALAGVNLILACFNLLPIEQLDGGRIFRCLLSRMMGAARGERAAAGLSRLAVLILCGFGLLVLRTGGNLTLFLALAWLLRGNKGKWAKRGVKSAKYHLQRDR